MVSFDAQLCSEYEWHVDSSQESLVLLKMDQMTSVKLNPKWNRNEPENLNPKF